MNTTIWRRFLPAAALVMAIALAGCDNSFGVFQGIQTEKAQVGTDIFKNATVKAFAEDATNYYAAMAKVYYRATADGSGTWTLLEVNGSTDYYCSGLVSDPVTGTVYVATSTGLEATLTGIYKKTASDTDWTALSTAAISSKIVDSLFWANGTLFVAAHEGTTYYLYYWNGSAFTSAGVTGLDVPVTGLAYDGSEYWAITSGTVFRGAAGSLAADTTSGTPSSAKTLGGICADSSNNIRVTTSDGLLYTHASGGAWTSVTVKSSAKLGVLMEVTGPASEKRLVIAQHNTNYGYYEYNPTTTSLVSGSKGFLSPTSSLYTTTIYNKPVLAFHLSNDGTTLLIGLASQGTNTYGLYSDVFSTTDDAWSGWTAE